MKAVWSALISVPGVAGLVGALLLCAVVWFFAPALLGVKSIALLVVLTALPFVVWIVVFVLLLRRRQKRDATLVAGATEADPKADEKARKADAAAAAGAAEERAIAGRLAEALNAMKAASAGKGGYLYERPWYVIIGPPGSGKTTAIRNSGLSFPLEAGRVAGVGGTRNCDWWISEQAVLIDTAGRYTTQDSDATTDKAGWERFLELIRRQRPRQPLNGVIVAFGADMLSRLDQAGRELHAQAVRRRVRELEQKLGQRLPVYFVVSKADLIVGFTEFFDDLDRDARNQVWGMTFPAEQVVEGHIDTFAQGFAALGQRLQDRVLERLQAERGPEQRARIVGFPAQFASLEQPLGALIQAAFGGSKLDAAPFLRGLYFTSGTQEGTPIDRLTGALSRAFGLDSRRPAAVMGQKGRSYFLGRLLRDVVINEAKLAARDRGLERRNRIVQVGAWCLAALAVGGGAVWAWSAATTEAARGEKVANALEGARTAAQGLPLDKVTAADDLARMVPYLDRVRDLPAASAGKGGRLGLSQEDKLQGAGQLAYKHALERVLMPRLLARLESQLRANMQNPAYLYVATRVYLMLGRQGPLDQPLIKEWMTLDWEQAYPGAVGAPMRESLAGHLDAALTEAASPEGLASAAIDGALVDEARRVFSRLPMSERVYARLRGSAADAAPWRLAEAIGPAGQRLFSYAKVKPLAEAVVPGLFTVDGLHRSFLPRLPQAIRDAASESWVLGPQAAAAATDPMQLETAVLRLYADDYVKAWQELLGKIDLVPFSSLAQAAEALNLLSAPNSPMRDLLQGVARQLSPGTPPAASAGAASAAASGAQAAASAAAAALPGQAAAASRVASALGIKSGQHPAPASIVGEAVDARFRPLREVSGKPLDGILAVMSELYTEVAKLAAAPPGAAPMTASPGLDPGQRLAGEAQRAPEPLSRWLSVVARSAGGVRSGGTRASVAAAAAQQLAPFCRGVDTRFPFRQDAAAPDMPMDDFVRLFGPGGVFDQLFAQVVRNYVDTRQKPWRPAVVEGAPPPVSPADIAQFQRAATIRDAFFPAALPGQASGAFRFELMPLALNAAGRGATLEVDGVKTVIPAGAAGARAIQMQWPSRGAVALSFDGDAPGAGLTDSGAWASLRFVARGRLGATKTQDRFRLTIQQGDRSAEFELRTGSIVHPFMLRELAEFRCPTLAP
jgi:type VI secretion system protein ImpL